MFNFWTRRARKPSTGPRSSNVLPLSQLDTAEAVKASSSLPLNLAEAPLEQQKGSTHRPPPANSERPPEEQSASQPTSKPYVTTTVNPHDSTISGIKNRLHQIDVTTSPRRTKQIADHRLSSDLSEPLFDPTTGEQRGMFDALHSASPTDSNPAFDPTATKLANDAVWCHLARIRELQSNIARMHTHMEGIGDTRHGLDLDVDADIDVDSVPTQEEEEAMKRQKAFEKLPRKFTGRSDNIDAVMAKLDELSQAVTAFHGLEPPPLNFQNNFDDDDLPSPLSSQISIPTNIRDKRMSFTTSIRSASGTRSRNAFSSGSGAGVMHESPVSIQNPNGHSL